MKTNSTPTKSPRRSIIAKAGLLALCLLCARQSEAQAPTPPTPGTLYGYVLNGTNLVPVVDVLLTGQPAQHYPFMMPAQSFHVYGANGYFTTPLYAGNWTATYNNYARTKLSFTMPTNAVATNLLDLAPTQFAAVIASPNFLGVAGPSLALTQSTTNFFTENFSLLSDALIAGGFSSGSGGSLGSQSAYTLLANNTASPAVPTAVAYSAITNAVSAKVDVSSNALAAAVVATNTAIQAAIKAATNTIAASSLTGLIPQSAFPVQTNNLNAALTNNNAGTATLNGSLNVNGAFLNVQNGSRLDSSAITTDGSGDMNINGSLNVFQVDGSPNKISGDAGGPNLIGRQEAFDVWGYGASGADYDLDLGVFAISNYEGYAVVIGSHGSIEYSSVWQPWTNVTGVASPYTADRGDLQIVDNMSAESGNKQITLPQATVVFADTEQNDMEWTFVRDGAALGPAYYNRSYSVYNLGSNTSHTLSVCTADHIAFTNWGGQINGTNIVIPNMTEATLTTFGTNGIIELTSLGPYCAFGSGLSNSIYAMGTDLGWGTGGGGSITSIAAAADSAGVVSWSGSPITSGSGTLTPTFAKMSASQFGVGEADGTTITASGGVLTSHSSGSQSMISGPGVSVITNNGTTIISRIPFTWSNYIGIVEGDSISVRTPTNIWNVVTNTYPFNNFLYWSNYSQSGGTLLTYSTFFSVTNDWHTNGQLHTLLLNPAQKVVFLPIGVNDYIQIFNSHYTAIQFITNIEEQVRQVHASNALAVIFTVQDDLGGDVPKGVSGSGNEAEVWRHQVNNWILTGMPPTNIVCRNQADVIIDWANAIVNHNDTNQCADGLHPTSEGAVNAANDTIIPALYDPTNYLSSVKAIARNVGAIAVETNVEFWAYVAGPDGEVNFPSQGGFIDGLGDFWTTNVTAQGRLLVAGSTMLDGGQIATDGSGDLTVGENLDLVNIGNAPFLNTDSSGFVHSGSQIPVGALTNLMYWLTNTLATSQNYILQYHNGVLQWISTNTLGGGGGGGGSYSFSQSTNINLIDGGAPNTTHIINTLGVVPSVVQLWLVCVTNGDASGMHIGDRIVAESVTAPSYGICCASCIPRGASNLDVTLSSRGATSFQCPGFSGQIEFGSFNNFQLQVTYGP